MILQLMKVMKLQLQMLILMLILILYRFQDEGDDTVVNTTSGNTEKCS